MVRHISMPGQQPKATRGESKAEVTTAAAQQIIDTEVAARKAKTERLRAARLAMPVEEPEPAKNKRVVKKKAAAR